MKNVYYLPSVQHEGLQVQSQLCIGVYSKPNSGHFLCCFLENLEHMLSPQHCLRVLFGTFPGYAKHHLNFIDQLSHAVHSLTIFCSLVAQVNLILQSHWTSNGAQLDHLYFSCLPKDNWWRALKDIEERCPVWSKWHECTLFISLWQAMKSEVL